ncbi:HAMP domain-containing protein [Bacillus sp. BRMEA1]|uniref:methyl-accepting chemotaxis protein n=1 Tax=Neobacillus endophyticus TaxID=2738405 RepID=UPI001563C6DE|nr:methyl-accepting chemotaxis protein [Neobacillus endophyticus]NRD79393.1 HAMP domain-containing protein [Neobacillus endophyticus]
MKIKTKLFIGIGILILLMIGALGISYKLNHNSQESYNDIIQNSENIRFDIKSIQFRLAGVSNDERGYLLTSDPQYTTEMKSKKDEINQFIASLKKLKLDENDTNMLNEIEGKYSAFLNASDQVVQAFQLGDVERAKQIHFEDERNARKALDPLISQFLSNKDNSMKKNINNLSHDIQIGNDILIFIGLLFIGLGVVIGFSLFRSIIKPIQLVHLQLQKIAEGEGDLTTEIEIKTNDEISHLAISFNELIKSLRHLIVQVRNNTELVAESAEHLTAIAEQTSKSTEEISNAMYEVASGTEKQSQIAEETSKTINEMSIGVQLIASNSQVVSNTAVEATEKASIGGQAVKTAVNQMSSIRQTVNGLSHIIKELNDHSNEIGQIIEVITGIAAQTNLLALNAAIEAARAGEHGKGFAVVADEVRKLAEQSADSAQQISQLVAMIQEETKKAVQSMDNTTKEVLSGIGVINSAGQSFDEIQDTVHIVTSQIQEVASAVQEMAAGTNQIVHSIQNITNVSETVAAGTQEVSTAAEEQSASMNEITSSASSLSTMAADLQKLIGRFKV